MHMHTGCSQAQKVCLYHRKSHNKAPNQACCQVYPDSTTRVQSSIDSRNSAIHKGYHTSLRPSSLSEPRHPSLKVVREAQHNTKQTCTQLHNCNGSRIKATQRHPNLLPARFHMREADALPPHPEPHHRVSGQDKWMRANDPSAGSPTETLLRLLLPLSDKVH